MIDFGKVRGEEVCGKVKLAYNYGELNREGR